MAPMPTLREGHSCGLVQDPLNGPEVIVAGGSYMPYTVDIYSIDTDSWREGNTILKKPTFYKECNKVFMNFSKSSSTTHL